MPKILIVIAMLVALPASGADVLFYDSFDNQPDWTSDDYINDKTLPNGWFSARAQEEWSPATGFPESQPNAQILAANADRAVNGMGKSYVMYRESEGVPKQWNSDSILALYLPELGAQWDRSKQYDPALGYDEVYLQFDITFSNDMIARYYDHSVGQGKIARIFHFDGEPGKLYSYFEGKQNPALIWDMSGGHSAYGFRNLLAFLPRQVGSDYDAVLNPPHQMHMGGMSASYFSTIKGMMPDGSDSILPNLLLNDGTPIGPDRGELDQIFGNEQTWVTMGLYVKINSAPGVHDGVFMQWLNDQRIMHLDEIAWVDDGRNMVKWNVIAIGGNDAYNHYPAEDKDEHWFAIDNVLVATHLPDVWQPSATFTLAPPNDFLVERVQ